MIGLLFNDDSSDSRNDDNDDNYRDKNDHNDDKDCDNGGNDGSIMLSVGLWLRFDGFHCPLNIDWIFPFFVCVCFLCFYLISSKDSVSGIVLWHRANANREAILFAIWRDMGNNLLALCMMERNETQRTNILKDNCLPVRLCYRIVHIKIIMERLKMRQHSVLLHKYLFGNADRLVKWPTSDNGRRSISTAEFRVQK